MILFWGNKGQIVEGLDRRHSIDQADFEEDFNGMGKFLTMRRIDADGAI